MTIKLLRKPSGDTFEFRGQITIGTSVTEVTSTDNSDLSEKEFLDNQTSDDGITPQPKDFTEVSPESVGVRVKLDAALDYLKSLRGEGVEIGLSSLAIACDAMRAGEQTINLTVDPERAAALIARTKSAPGVTAVGWTSGAVEMDRTIRFAAADWRDGDKINKDKIASTISSVLSKTLSAKPASADWNATHRKAEADPEAPEPDLSRAWPDREPRDHRAGLDGQTGRLRPADAVDLEPGHHDHGRKRGSQAEPVGRSRR